MSYLKFTSLVKFATKTNLNKFTHISSRNLSSEGSQTLTFDLVVVGGGSGGLACAKEAASLGKKVAVLDHVEPTTHGTKWGLGGTCVNVGCIPKKLCHHSALVGGVIKNASRSGWSLKEAPKHDWELMIKNINNYIKSLNFKHKVKLIESQVKYLNTQGMLFDNRTVRCAVKSRESTSYYRGPGYSDVQLNVEHIVIATGKRPRIPKIPGVELCITSDDIFWRSTPPGKTLCVGAGYVSLELAGFLQGLGYPTTVMARSVALSKFDQQMATLVTEAMQRHGTRILLHTVPEKIEKAKGNKIKVTWRSSTNGVSHDVFDTVVMAIGRTAEHNKNIGLRNVGVQLDSDGCVVGNYGKWKERSSVPNIFAIGDSLQDSLELTPVAARAGKLLARRLYDNGTEHMDYENVATTVFTPIEYAFVGQSEEQAVSQYGEENIEVYHAFYKPLEFTITDMIDQEKSCYIKAIVERSPGERVLGLHLTGPNAGEIMQGFAVAFKCGLTYPQLATTVGIHPTVAEEVIKLHITKRSGNNPNVTSC